MVKEITQITAELDDVVNCFCLVLRSLKIKEGTTGSPIFLRAFPVLKGIDGIDKWSITILKANLTNDCKAVFMSQYKNTGIMRCYIILDATFFIAERVSQVLRKIVVTHMFTHFLALFFASISVTERNLAEKLKERLSKKIEEITNDQILELYLFLDKMSPIEDFENHPQTKDEHFRLGVEDMSLSYADIFKNLMLSRQLFDEYFLKSDKEKFSNLFRAGNYGAAYEIYMGIAKKIAQEQWLPENFAIVQANSILTKFYAHELQ